MNQRFLNINIAMIASIIAIFFLGSSCKNDVQEVLHATEIIDIPLRVQYGIHYEYSDSARKKLDIKAPEAIDHSEKNEPYQEFPKGIEVTFYDKNGIQEAYIKANYAKHLIKENRWEARGNVVVKNNKNEQLNSEELVWDEKNKTIFSEQFVKITTDESIIMGNGFEADQAFESWKIFNPTGTIEIEDNEIEEP